MCIYALSPSDLLLHLTAALNVDTRSAELVPHVFCSLLYSPAALLYTGGDQGAADIRYLRSLGVTQILNCTVSCKNFFESADCFQYTRVPLNDTADEDISPYFDATYRAIEAARLSKTAAYCHCKKGISRSSTIVIAYLMRHKSLSLIRSLELVKSCRLEASPQPAFMMQLAAYERQLFNGRCT
jgi:protein-tyrosine phosphatase